MREVPDPTCVTMEVEVAVPLQEARRRVVDAILSAVATDEVDDDRHRTLKAMIGPWYGQREHLLVELEPLTDGTLLRITSQDYAGPEDDELRRNVHNVSMVVARLDARAVRVAAPRRHRVGPRNWEITAGLAIVLLVLAFSILN